MGPQRLRCVVVFILFSLDEDGELTRSISPTHALCTCVRLSHCFQLLYNR